MQHEASETFPIISDADKIAVPMQYYNLYSLNLSHSFAPYN